MNVNGNRTNSPQMRKRLINDDGGGDNDDDDEQLKIITHSKPVRRRQSGTSLIPFRPYVKYLTGIRQSHSYTNGFDPWKVNRDEQIFYHQPNARCIGTLIDDCSISDTIRWDITSESTHLPMMCKLWIICDGAIVERGKPRLVQDAAVQVFTAGESLRSIRRAEENAEQRFTHQTNRRRRQSWHELNEYHSVPYYQYSRTIRNGFDRSIQCHFDDQLLKTSSRKFLHQIEEKDFSSSSQNHKEIFEETKTTNERVQISIMTQTEIKQRDQSTTIDQQFVRMFNLSLETNEILLSSIVNPYQHVRSNENPVETYSTIHLNENGKICEEVSTSTGDDYPSWWTKLSTETILSDRITQENLSQSQQRLSSSSTMNIYQIIDDVHHRGTSTLKLPSTRSSRQSDTGYNTFVSSGENQSSNISFDRHQSRERIHSTSSTTTTTLIHQLFERYEKTLKEREMNDVLQRYRMKRIDQENPLRSARSMELQREISSLSIQSKDDRLMNKYRRMPGITSEEMIQGYIPPTPLTPRRITGESIRQRSPRFVDRRTKTSSNDFCDLCLNDYPTSSAWIRYNEQRIEQIQKRIDRMLQFDDREDLTNFLTPIEQTIHRRYEQIPKRKSHSFSLPTTPRQEKRSTTPNPPKTVRISSPPVTSIHRSSNIRPQSVTPSKTHVWQSQVDGKLYVLEQFSIPRYYRLYNDVSFRELFQFSRLLDQYIDPTEKNIQNYSKLVKNFALEQQQIR